jgi:N-acetylneuraminic acid mutarotase
MYVLGGTGHGRAAAFASVLKFDGTTSTWSDVAPMPDARLGVAACAIGSDIYVFGGRNDLIGAHSSVFLLDTEANE